MWQANGPSLFWFAFLLLCASSPLLPSTFVRLQKGVSQLLQQTAGGTQRTHRVSDKQVQRRAVYALFPVDFFKSLLLLRYFPDVCVVCYSPLITYSGFSQRDFLNSALSKKRKHTGNRRYQECTLTGDYSFPWHWTNLYGSIYWQRNFWYTLL